MENIKLINDDCLNVMKDIPDKSIDMVLCDLPYEVSACKWDKLIPFDKLWEEYERIVKDNGAIVLFGREPFTSKLILSNLKLYRQKLTWLKTRPTNVMNAKKQFMNWFEDIVVFYKNLPIFNPQMRKDGVFTGEKIQRCNTDRSKGTLGQTGEKKNYIHKSNNGLFYPKSVLEFSNVNNNKAYHPTQKPVALLEYLIKTYTNEGDLVLDNTFGSGSTAVACVNTDRRFIGMELNKEYYDIAVKRVNDAIAERQSRLF